jgi:hypothetical protein
MPAINEIPDFIRNNYEIHEWKHAAAILMKDYPDEWSDLMDLLNQFRLLRSEIMTPGGRKSPIADKIDGFLFDRGWTETGFETKIVVDEDEHSSPTHKVDCFKNEVAIEIEWNNKDPFYDRDLNNFRLLFELRVIAVGIIITRCDCLQDIFNSLGRGPSYGASTTHMSKLLPRIEGGSGGGCPILVFGISDSLYIDDSTEENDGTEDGS